MLANNMLGIYDRKFFLKPIQGFDICVLYTQGSPGKMANPELWSINRFAVLIKSIRAFPATNPQNKIRYSAKPKEEGMTCQ